MIMKTIVSSVMMIDDDENKLFFLIEVNHFHPQNLGCDWLIGDQDYQSLSLFQWFVSCGNLFSLSNLFHVELKHFFQVEIFTSLA